MPVEEGKAAPAFTLTDASGNKVSLKDFRGKDVIVYFYPKDDTPGCTKEACGFRGNWKEIQKTGTVVLGISPDDEASHKKFIAKYKLPFTLLCDPNRKVMEKYGAYGEKMMYGKKTVGVIRSTTWVGPDGKVKKHWKRVPSAAAPRPEVINHETRTPTTSPRWLRVGLACRRPLTDLDRAARRRQGGGARAGRLASSLPAAVV